MSSTAAIKYDKCHPAQCSNGICPAAVTCKRKIIRQESAYQYPIFNTVNCTGCKACVAVCPSGAILLINS